MAEVSMMAAAAPTLPDSGAALAHFKRAYDGAHANPVFRPSAAILDDPTTRLAELQGFSELEGLDPDDHEVVATAGCEQASLEQAQATQLAPQEYALSSHLAAIESLLDGACDQEDVPELPVILQPHLLLGDHESANDHEVLACHGVVRASPHRENAPDCGA